MLAGDSDMAITGKAGKSLQVSAAAFMQQLGEWEVEYVGLASPACQWPSQ